LLITKCDLIYGKDQTQRKKTYRNCNDDAIETKKKELVRLLDMEGAFDNRGQLWVNLTDDNGHQDAQVDRDTLVFLKKLVQPIPKQEINHDYPGWKTSLHLKVIYIKQKCGGLLNQDMRVHFHQVFIFLMIVVIVVAVLFHLVAKDPANSAKS
jgi:G3E family GTPase